MHYNLRQVTWAVFAFAVVTIGGIWVSDAYGWVVARLFSSPETITIDFQATQGCVTGRLVELSRHFDDSSLRLERGADRLVICDPDVLRTNVVNAPGDIARTFPGCLLHRSGSLLLLRASNAVCELKAQNIFICDGDAAGSYPGLAALGEQSTPVSQCSIATISKFGFKA